VELDFDAVKKCSCWQDDSRCPACAHFQSQVDELEWYDARLVDLVGTGDDIEEGSDSRSCSCCSTGDCDSDGSSSDDDESSSAGDDLASGPSCGSCRHSSSSSRPVVPQLQMLRVQILPEDLV
jgi:hypothetical protein